MGQYAKKKPLKDELNKKKNLIWTYNERDSQPFYIVDMLLK